MSLMLRSATQLAAMVRSREVAPRELAEEAVARIEALDRELNAFTFLDAEGALAAADAIEPGDTRPFAGVPIAIKDLGTSVAGQVLSCGSDLFGDYRPREDSFLVRRLRRAGFVLVGKTNTPELGILPVTEPRRFGPARNPWDPGRTPGGSSGGAGAAVAAGMVPVAHGSDGGGSIRIPAACCGLVGLKPSRGRISRGPQVGDSVLATEGVLTRTVADSAALLDVLEGYEPGDTTWAPSPSEPYAAAARREPGSLHIALVTEPALPYPVDPVCADAAREAAALLESLGHRVEEVAPPYLDEELANTFRDFWAIVVSAGVLGGEAAAGRPATPDDVEPLTWWLHELACGIPAGRGHVLEQAIKGIGRRVAAWSLQYDAILTPALAERPLPIGTIDPCGPDPRAEFRRSGAFTPFTAIWNVTGQPAVALPLFHGEDGLPLAVQIVGPPLGEDRLFSLGAQLEAARPWADRVPDLAAAA